jgi:hypothetical protein
VPLDLTVGQAAECNSAWRKYAAPSRTVVNCPITRDSFVSGDFAWKKSTSENAVKNDENVKIE